MNKQYFSPLINKEEINFDEQMKAHQLWLDGDPRGVRLKLHDCSFKPQSFTNYDFQQAFIVDVDFSSSLFVNCDFSHAWMNNVSFHAARLYSCVFNGAELHRVDFQNAALGDNEFRHTEIVSSIFSNAHIKDTYWLNSKVHPCCVNFHLNCPETGSFVGYKKAANCIIKLQIPEDALRSSATSRKCRASKATVLEIVSIDKRQFLEKIASDYDASFIYKVGETVEVENFDKDRWNECSTGIHFFMTREEAILY